MTVTGARLATPSMVARLLTAERRRALRDGLVVAGVAAALIVGWRAIEGPSIDAHAYWSNRPPVTYEAAVGVDGAYLYSPAFAQALSPLTALPWEVFQVMWVAIALAVLGLLSGLVLLLPAVMLTSNEVLYGNIHLLIAAAVVVGFRHPWAWSFVLLTKVTPGVGLLWFAVRREWRALAIALGATAAVVAVSFALDPAGWFGWLALLERSATAGAGHGTVVPGPLPLRMLGAAVVVAWGAHTDRPWTVPLAVFVALPHGTIGMAVLVGVVATLRRTRWSPQPKPVGQ